MDVSPSSPRSIAWVQGQTARKVRENLTFDQPLQWNGIGMFLEMLIGTRGDSLLRLKGLLNLAGQGSAAGHPRSAARLP